MPPAPAAPPSPPPAPPADDEDCELVEEDDEWGEDPLELLFELDDPPLPPAPTKPPPPPMFSSVAQPAYAAVPAKPRAIAATRIELRIVEALLPNSVLKKSRRRARTIGAAVSSPPNPLSASGEGAQKHRQNG